MSLLGHIDRRHPLCPRCGYNLVATVAEGRTVCPECGCELERYELVRETLPGEWTFWRGLRKAIGILLLRSVLCAIAWAAVVWGMTALAGALGPALSRGLSLLLSLACGIAIITTGGAIGAVLARNIEDHAGFMSPLLVVIVTACAWTSLVTAAAVVGRLGGIGSGQAYLAVPVAGLLALFLILKATVLDDV